MIPDISTIPKNEKNLKGMDKDGLTRLFRYFGLKYSLLIWLKRYISFFKAKGSRNQYQKGYGVQETVY
jgi:hypothetical protein